MGYITEQKQHPILPDVEIILDKHGKGEERMDYDFVDLWIGGRSVKSPFDLIALGQWLVEEGERIKREYKPNGVRIRKVKNI